VIDLVSKAYNSPKLQLLLSCVVDFSCLINSLCSVDLISSVTAVNLDHDDRGEKHSIIWFGLMAKETKSSKGVKNSGTDRGPDHATTVLNLGSP
jgi:hypothetical protein